MTESAQLYDRSSWLSADARAIFERGVAAVQPAALISRHVKISAGNLRLGPTRLSLAGIERVVVVGAGKASGAMAAALVTRLQPALKPEQQLVGWVNVPDDCADEAGPVHLHHSRPAGSNLPTEQVVAGTCEIVALVESLGPKDICFCLISGGGSALLALPAAGISLEDKRAASSLLSARGASIQQLNRVRRQLSQVKGGGLVARRRAGEFISLILSDVLGDPLELIASGPTVSDPANTPESALAVFSELGISLDELPTSVSTHLLRSSESRAAKEQLSQQTVSPALNVLVGNLTAAISAAAEEARARGYEVLTEVQQSPSATADEEGVRLAEWILHHRESARPVCLISGGEPTVRLCPQPGQGGRNQQLALAWMKTLLEPSRNHQTNGSSPDFCLLSAGTDGEDGNTTAAGAIVDGEFIRRCRNLRLDLTPYLKANDANRFFIEQGGLLSTGPTGTNVGDLRILLVENRQTAGESS
jgi:glycerate 2-kinase